VFIDAQNGILLASVPGMHKMCLLLCVPRSCVFVCLCVGMFIAERVLRQDEKKNLRFFDGYMVRSSVVEADPVQHEPICLLAEHAQISSVQTSVIDHAHNLSHESSTEAQRHQIATR
jgi:hypothetical protein